MSENEQLKTELNALRRFAQAVMLDWYEATLDGGELQELGVLHGLLREVERTEPCEGPCPCVDIYSPDEWPVTCFQRTKLLDGDLDFSTTAPAMEYGAPPDPAIKPE